MITALTVAYILGQDRTVRVQADGEELTLQTRSSNDAALLRRAGVDLRDGDRVTELRSGDGAILRVDRARDVVVRSDGMEYRIRTHALTVEQVLEEAAIVLDDRDSVVRDGALLSTKSPIEPPMLLATSPSGAGFRKVNLVVAAIEIEVRRAVPIVIVADGREILTTSSRPTVAMALREAGIQVRFGDRVRPGDDAAIESGARVELQRAHAITIALPGEHRVIYALESTLGEALAASGISLPVGAITDPSADTPVTAELSVRVIQLSSSSSEEREYIASDVVYEEDASLAPGETRTIEGNDGVRVRRYDVNYVDGVEAGRALIDEYWDPEPIDTIVYHPPERPAPAAPPPSDPGGIPAGATTLRVWATWYNAASSGRSPNDPYYGITATGVRVTYGVVAVDPNVIPLGTRMYIPGYGYGVAADTGGAVKGYIIDLGYPDGVAVDWQTGWIDIYVLP
jgi:uncharacterized protein YabE (DUF348 family)/3D (Asp-Asp-Asp) domain-containing protein